MSAALRKGWSVGLAAAVVALMLALPAHAVTPDEVLKDPALEARARSLSAELRCLVCQNQSIDDSDADLARDLRLLVRERLMAGDSDAEIRRFVVDRYGEFVLLNPPLGWGTVALWTLPFLTLGGGALFLASRLRARPKAGEPEPLSAAERAALEARIAAHDR
jgi:cytochrome c-type biogenesis protein CcmH